MNRSEFGASKRILHVGNMMTNNDSSVFYLKERTVTPMKLQKSYLQSLNEVGTFGLFQKD